MASLYGQALSKQAYDHHHHYTVGHNEGTRMETITPQKLRCHSNKIDPFFFFYSSWLEILSVHHEILDHTNQQWRALVCSLFGLVLSRSMKRLNHWTKSERLIFITPTFYDDVAFSKRCDRSLYISSHQQHPSAGASCSLAQCLPFISLCSFVLGKRASMQAAFPFHIPFPFISPRCSFGLFGLSVTDDSMWKAWHWESMASVHPEEAGSQPVLTCCRNKNTAFLK